MPRKASKRLKLDGDRLSFTLTGMMGSAHVESCLVDLVVKSMNESVTVKLSNVRTVNNMTISTSCIVKTEYLARWPHL